MPIPAPEDDLEYLEQVLAKTRQTMRGLRAAQARILEVVGQAETKDGLIEATADGRGDLTRLRIDPRALRLGEAELGRQVTLVLQEAQEDAARQAQEIAGTAMSEVPEMPAPLDETFVRARVEQVARDLL
ncbi:YbaB/EbfC family nucleoid-associated protein [Nonomuraea turkmeniaca]|uniref:YbaB/EbfC family nucleoid-associated protein n=1 Tax=Nonomuraea turkmeniaca TaxID=103838 RepID=A0A5S4FM09_9ACTN|nr:YbaB/EbfC family nucleoid-associated protein [Nonomuraea turkmeniaca]TMR21685.1 YbaB/EbfC family nucleoid-associated protein [Nonomuraea turkmeniaca]